MTSHFALPLLVDLPPSLSTAVTGGCLKMKKKAVRLWNLKQPKCVTRVWLQDQVGRASTLRWQFSSVAQLCPTLQPHGLQHTRPPCPFTTPGACSNSYPPSRWYHPNSSSSVVPFFSCLQSFPTSGFFKRVSSHQVAKVLKFQLQHLSFQWTFRTDFL